MRTLHGAGNGRDNRSDAIIRLMRDAPPGSFDSALLAGGWNLLNQDGLRVFLEAPFSWNLLKIEALRANA